MRKIFNFDLHDYSEAYYRIYEKLKHVDFDTIPSFRLLRQYLDLKDGDVLLDAGCGAGHLLDYVSEGKNIRAIGIDGSKAAVRLAGEKNRPHLYSRQDLRAISLKSHSIDKILCFNVIEHIGEQEQVMLELRRVLKAKGILVIGTNIKDSIQWWLYQKTVGEHTHIREFSVAEFVQFVGGYFKIRSYKKSSGVFRFKPPLSWIFHYVLQGDIIVQCVHPDCRIRNIF